MKKKIVLDAVSELYSNWLELYLHECNQISANKKENLANKDSFDDLASDHYDYSPWFEELTDVPPICLLEGDEEEVKEKAVMKILAPNKHLTRHPVLLAGIKAENN